MMLLPRAELKLLGRLAAYSIRCRPSIVFITLFGVLSSIIELAAISSVIPLSTLSTGHALSATSRWASIPRFLALPADAQFFVALFLGLLLLRMVTVTATQLLISHTFQRLFGTFSSRAYDAFMHHLSLEDIVRHQIGHYITLAGDEANRAAQIVVALIRLIPLVTLFALYLAAIVSQSWQFGLGLSAFLVLAVVSLRGTFKKSLALGSRQQSENREASTLFLESLNGLRTVRSFSAEEFVSVRYSSIMRQYTWTCFLNDATSLVSQVPAIVLTSLLLVLVVSGGNTWLALHVPLVLAGAMMFIRLVPLANTGIESAIKLTSNMRAGRNVAEMLEIIKTKPSKAESLTPCDGEAISTIEFDRVSFRYTQDAPLVLDEVSMLFERGKSYAITGPSGGGKSSSIDLLLKFFEPTGGVIRVNGKDIRSVSHQWVRTRIVLAEQVTRLFYGTVSENVSFGRGSDSEAVDDALELAGLDELMRSLPTGSATLINYQGSNFSGGQRQRIGLARAILRNADVLILDESTNALDVATRERILASLIARYRDRILIFVTHDPYVIESVDNVVLLSGNRKGPHLDVVAGRAQFSPIR